MVDTSARQAGVVLVSAPREQSTQAGEGDSGRSCSLHRGLALASDDEASGRLMGRSNQPPGERRRNPRMKHLKGSGCC